MSLTETYQSRKNLLAANLTQQGVTASGNEGLTTLINKVLDISHTSTPTTLKTYINGVEVDNTQELPATIISYADGEYVDYKFVVLDENDNPVQGYSIPLSVGGSEVTPTPVTDGNGEVNYRYVSGGVGDTNININCTLVTETYEVEDNWLVDNATSDKTSHFDSSLPLRNNGASTISFATDSYSYHPTVNNSESLIPIHICEGLNDFTVEFDGKLGDSGILGLVVYKESGNWIRLGNTNFYKSESKSVNGTFTEIESQLSMSANTWYHFKYEITGNTVKRTVKNGNTVILEDTVSVDSTWFTSSTKYGFPALWGTSWIMYFKNLKVKPL